MPPLPKQIEVEKHGSESVYDGNGIRETYSLTIRRNGLSASCKFVVVRPKANKRYPTVIKNDRAAFKEEVDADTQFAGEEAVKRGYLLCRFNREDLATDARGVDRSAGVYPLYPEYEWRALAVWGWAHGVVLDALNQHSNSLGNRPVSCAVFAMEQLVGLFVTHDLFLLRVELESTVEARSDITEVTQGCRQMPNLNFGS